MADRRRRSKAVPVYLASLSAFTAALGGLGYQMSVGQDPALGAPKQVAAVAPAPAPKRVLIRRIEKTIIVTRVLPPKAPKATAAPVGSGSAYVPQAAPVAYAPAPRAVAAAPVAAAPVRVAAPAPPPPPPPAPVTRSS
jgi:hypothetical protein